MSRLRVIETVTVEELTYAYAVGSAAASGATPQAGVGGMGIDLRKDDGDVERIELTDIPLNRAAIAIRDQFPEGMLMPLMLRIMALQEMIALPESARFVRPVPDNPDHIEISEAMFRIASVMPLNRKLRFNRKTFFKRVADDFAANPD